MDLGVFGIDPNGCVAGVEQLQILFVQKKHATFLGEVFRQLAALGYAKSNGLIEIGQGERAHGRRHVERGSMFQRALRPVERCQVRLERDGARPSTSNEIDLVPLSIDLGQRDISAQLPGVQRDRFVQVGDGLVQLVALQLDQPAIDQKRVAVPAARIAPEGLAIIGKGGSVVFRRL